MSAGDLKRIKRELGMVEGVRCKAGAFYEIHSAWLRDLIHENDALHKIVADYHCGGNEKTLKALFAERDALRALIDSGECCPPCAVCRIREECGGD